MGLQVLPSRTALPRVWTYSMRRQPWQLDLVILSILSVGATAWSGPCRHHQLHLI